MDDVFEEGATLVVVAGPAPHVLFVAVGFAVVEDDGCDDPHDGGEDEETESEGAVVEGDFLSFVMPASEVVPEYEEAHDEGYTGDAEDDDLWPG